LIRLTLTGEPAGIPPLPTGVAVVTQENNQLTLRVGRAEAPALTAHLLNTLPVADLAVENPPIEAVIDRIYQAGSL
jgi:ABC-2 type transport system ATP-binding protein